MTRELVYETNLAHMDVTIGLASAAVADKYLSHLAIMLAEVETCSIDPPRTGYSSLHIQIRQAGASSKLSRVFLDFANWKIQEYELRLLGS